MIALMMVVDDGLRYAADAGMVAAGFTPSHVYGVDAALEALRRAWPAAIVVDAASAPIASTTADALHLLHELRRFSGEMPLRIGLVARGDSPEASRLLAAGVELLVVADDAEETLANRGAAALRRALERGDTLGVESEGVAMAPVLLEIALGLGGCEAKDLDEKLAAYLETFGRAEGLSEIEICLFDGSREMYVQWIRWHAGRPPTAATPLPRPVTAMSYAIDRILVEQSIEVGALSELPPAAASERQQLQARGVAAWSVTPIVSRRDVIGFLSLGRSRPGAWTSAHLTAHDQLAELVAQAWSRWRAARPPQPDTLDNKCAAGPCAAARCGTTVTAATPPPQPVGPVGDPATLRWIGQAGITAARAASALSRDLTQLVSMVDGHTQLLAEHVDAGGRAALADLTDVIAQAQFVGEQLVAFDSDAPEQATRTHVNDHVANLGPLLRALLAGRAPFALRCEARRSWVQCDPLWLRRVVAHVVLSARDVGGLTELTVVTRDGQQGAVMLSVYAAGCRLGGQSAPRRVTSPSGLPVANISALMEAVRARGIDARIELGDSGSQLTLTLPGAKKRDQGTRTLHFGAKSTGRTVLIVDDDTLLRQVLVRLLTRGGYRVLEAADGIDALALLERLRDKAGTVGAERVDLLVTDVYMPNMNGPDLVGTLARDQRSVPTLFMSAYANAGSLGRQMRGEVAFLAKPFKADQLLARVAELVAA